MLTSTIFCSTKFKIHFALYDLTGNLKVHMSTHEDRNSFNRRGRRLGLDGFPRFDGLPPPPTSVGFPGYPGNGFLQPPKAAPDLFLPRFPLMGLPGMNGFMSPHSNDISMVQPPGQPRSLQMSPPDGPGPKVPFEEAKEHPDLKNPREVSQAS